MTNLTEIEALAGDYAKSSKELAGLVVKFQDQVEKLKREFLEKVRPVAEKTAQDRALLSAAIQQNPDFFIKPRTYVLHGIKLGLQKQKGELEIADEATTIRLIRKLFPDEAEALIQIRESVIKSALNNLPAGELRKIGVTIGHDTDAVLIKSTVGDVEKFVHKLIADSADKHEAALVGE